MENSVSSGSINWRLIKIDLPKENPPNKTYRMFMHEMQEPFVLALCNTSCEEDSDEDISDRKAKKGSKPKVCKTWKMCIAKLRAVHIRCCTDCGRKMSTKLLHKLESNESINLFKISQYEGKLPPSNVKKQCRHQEELRRKRLSSDISEDESFENMTSYDRMQTCQKLKKCAGKLRNHHRRTCTICKSNRNLSKSKLSNGEIQWRCIKIDIPPRKFQRDPYRFYIKRWEESLMALGDIDAQNKTCEEVQPKLCNRRRKKYCTSDVKIYNFEEKQFSNSDIKWKLVEVNLPKLSGDSREIVHQQGKVGESVVNEFSENEEDEGIELEERSSRSQQEVEIGHVQDLILFEVTDENVRSWMPGDQRAQTP